MKSKSKEKDKEKKPKTLKKKKSKSTLNEDQNDKSEDNTIPPIITNENPEKETNSIIQTQINPLLNNNNPLNYYNQIQSDNINSKNQFLNNNNNNIPQKEKCDGCYQGDAICYCINCNKLYCKICDDQIHIVPSNRNHEKKPISDNSHFKKLCFNHNSPLKYFCETCEEPICQECQILGPHNGKIHKIISIYDSFNKKYNNLSQIINKNIKSKYNQSMNQLQYLDYVSEQVKSYKNNIERGIRKDYTEMLDNLNSIEGKKLAVINYDSVVLQKDINMMQEIMSYLNEMNNNENTDLISFLLKYKQINEMVEYILAKPIKTKIDITLDDFPIEQEENRKKLENYKKLEELCKFKDEIIWKLLTNNQYNKESNEINEKTKNEIQEWVKLSDKYALELQKYNLVCDFCGCYLDENVVNSACEKNVKSEIDYNNTYFYGNILPPQDIFGSGRHYFVSPRNDENTIKTKNNPFEENQGQE